jgi:hypothetical protein
MNKQDIYRGASGVAGSVVEPKLKLAVLKRVKKLKKLRRRQRLWGAAGVTFAVVASAPLLYCLITGALPAISFGDTIYIADGWAVLVGCVFVGWLGSMLFYGQYRRDKDKYDKIRAGAVSLLQEAAPICECKWYPCTCKDDLIRELSEKFDINLSY